MDNEYDPPDCDWDHCHACGNEYASQPPHSKPCHYCGSTDVAPITVPDLPAESE
jgi:rRNA maturation endonuclease Nob1